MIGARNDAPVAGFALGFFWGPLGLLLAFLRTGDLKTCEHCLEQVQHDATICKHCRQTVMTSGAGV